MSQRERDAALSRQRPLVPARTALLIIDAQNWVMDEAHHGGRASFHADARGRAIPDMRRLIAAARQGGIGIVRSALLPPRFPSE